MRRVLKRFHPPGTAPGTLPAPMEGVSPTSTLLLITYDEAHRSEHSLDDVGEVRSRVPEGARAWLRIVGHDPAVVTQLNQHLGVHPLVLEDVLNIGQHPKVEDYDDYLFVVVDAIRAVKEGPDAEEQISLLLFRDLLVTVEERPNGLFNPVDERLRGNKGRIRAAGVDYLAYALLDTVVDHFFPLLEGLSDEMERLEDKLLDRAERADLELLHDLKRRLLRLRKATWPLRELVSSLARSQSTLVRDETRVWLRDLRDHAMQALDLVETFREISASLTDLYLSSVSNRMNEVMKVLTIIATIFMPLGFMAGVYGMNFNRQASPFNMPELDWYLGYPLVLGLMAGVAGVMLVAFRRRGWL